MLESLEHSDKSPSHMQALFSSDSLILDLDSNLAFENVSWINENLLSSDKFDTKDHSYSQRSRYTVEGMSESLPSGEASQSLPGQVSSAVLSRKEALEKFSSEGTKTSNTVEAVCTELEKRNGVQSCGVESNPTGLDQHYCEYSNFPNGTTLNQIICEDESSSLNQQNLLLHKGDHEKQPLGSGSSLSFLLEETGLDFDLDTLLDADTFLTTDHLQQPLSESDLLALDLDDSFNVITESNGSLASHTNHEHHQVTHLGEHYSDHSHQTLDQMDQPSITDFDFSRAFNSDGSHWTSLSSASTGDEFLLDFDDSLAPLTLEELFTRTFNEELHKGPLSSEPLDSSLHRQDAFPPSDFANETADFNSPWSDCRWQCQYLDSLGISVETRPEILSERDSCTVESSKTEYQDCVAAFHEPLTTVGHTKTMAGSEYLESRNEGDHSTSGTPSEDFPGRNEQRLAQVRKYKRLNTKSNSTENLKRNFQCTYPECQRFYAKLSHLKAHLRRHNGERSFKCDWRDCRWQFSRSDELSRHRRSHYGIKPYPCTLCVKRFTRSDHLAKHLKVHERQKHKMMMKTLLRKTKTKK